MSTRKDANLMTLFYLVRHGTTTDSNKGIIRGDRDSKLDRSGFLDAHKLKEFFKGKDWDKIFTSDMTRAIQTATIIGEGKDKSPETPIEDLDPWNVGYLTGKDKKQFQPDMEVFVDHPDMVPMGGESQNNFFKRVEPYFIFFCQLGYENEIPSIVVGHSSIVHALSHFLWGPDHPAIAVKPGGAIRVFVNKQGDIDANEILKPGKDDSSFAGSRQPTS